MADSLPPVGSMGPMVPLPPEENRTVKNIDLPQVLESKGVSNPKKAIGEPFEALVLMQAATLRGLRYE